MPKTETIEDLLAIVKELRTECPWDRKQTHRSLAPHTVEEAYETIEAIEADDPAALSSELGDLLLHILMHAEIASETDRFDFDAIVRTLADKLVRRHPHVYGALEADDAEAVARNWEQQKVRTEGRRGLFDGMPRAMPALQRAERVQQKASALGFDWPDISGVFEKIEEERRELLEAIEQAEKPADRHDRPESAEERIADELGDLLFSIVNLSRFLDVRPEDALKRTTDRFIARFARVEEYAADEGREISDYSIDELEEFWLRAKRGDAGTKQGKEPG